MIRDSRAALYFSARKKEKRIMNDRELLPQSGQFYKANLHCHTVLSDGT